MRKKQQNNLLILVLVICMLTSVFAGCAREMTEEQSEALIALQNAVTYYETTDDLTGWEDLVALAAANRADGIGINWDALELPKTQEVTGGAAAGVSPTAYAAGIISSILKGEDCTQMVSDLTLMQNPETGAFDAVYAGQHVWAMITLNVALGKDGYDYDKAATYLLTFQGSDGGFGYSPESTKSDVQLTGIASVALAPYYEKHKKSTEMKALLSFYKENQTATGGYAGSDGETAGSIASAIRGLTALGKSMPTTEEGHSPIEALLAYQNEDGSFRAQLSGDHVFDAYSTRQATIALSDVINNANTYVLLAEDAESYRIQNVSGPAITIAIDYPEDAGLTDISEPFTVEEGASPLDAIVLYGKVTVTPVVLAGGARSGHVESISDVSGAENEETGLQSGWICTINGQLPEDATTAVLQANDVLTWTFTEDMQGTIME